ncbi:T9SS type A sorting domain-containing protein [Planktosalinus lacus]|uniref:Secretion system C-terminal sorting domain-containing protein n=1 Tax=Planktosalinus lacus TaxID=1526573 RepID=A0A8J2Y6C5_9FLAO|nr:T9SS type A sorting domain-containing protein [Planktosalinus lacus]GGD81129.1 hypothetical protein GCM10011312_01830 [Planktosalinus lacus]
MKKLILIVAFFVSQATIGQYYTFQVFTNYEEIFQNNGDEWQLVEPFYSFLSEHGDYDIYIAMNEEDYFDDDPGNYIFPMFVVPEQANAFEDLLINSDIIYKYIRYNDEASYFLDRLHLEYHTGMVLEFLGIQDGIVQTDHEPLNILFEAFQVDNYSQLSPSIPNFYLLRCNGCDISQLAQEIIDIEIVENAGLLEYSYILSLNEIEKTNGFILSPNPNNGNFEILLNSNELIGTSLVIFDALGRIVYEEKLLQFKSTIRLNGIGPGLYFAQLSYNERTSVKKVVVK